MNEYDEKEDFDNRLLNKLRRTSHEVLIRWLLDYAYEEMCEEFNNEILNEREAEEVTP